MRVSDWVYKTTEVLTIWWTDTILGSKEGGFGHNQGEPGEEGRCRWGLIRRTSGSPDLRNDIITFARFVLASYGFSGRSTDVLYCYGVAIGDNNDE